jgi:hypothetical protein
MTRQACRSSQSAASCAVRRLCHGSSSRNSTSRSRSCAACDDAYLKINRLSKVLDNCTLLALCIAR